jgi:hypothetical protein
LSLSFFKLGNSRGRVHFGSLGHLSQQSKDRFQARLGANKLVLSQAGQPMDGFLRRRSDVIVRLIAIRRVVLAQPSMFVGCLVIKIMYSWFWKVVFVLLLT